MGLMQVMPRTYDMLRQRYGLGGDPYEPHDNIMAGTAYIREMYDRYGSPGVPGRLQCRTGPAGSICPAATAARRDGELPRQGGPNLGTDIAATGPLAMYAGGDTATAPMTAELRRPVGARLRRRRAGHRRRADRHAHGIRWGCRYPPGRGDGGHAAAADTGRRRGDPAGRLGHPGRRLCRSGDFRDAIARARAHAAELLAGTQPAIMPVQSAGVLYRARLVGLSAESAAAACARLSGVGMDCFTVPPL